MSKQAADQMCEVMDKKRQYYIIKLIENQNNVEKTTTNNKYILYNIGTSLQNNIINFISIVNNW